MRKDLGVRSNYKATFEQLLIMGPSGGSRQGDCVNCTGVTDACSVVRYLWVYFYQASVDNN